MVTIEAIREAVSRLHATAYHGLRAMLEREPRPPYAAKFSIPRHPTDDDEIVYAAIEELKSLREFEEDVRGWSRSDGRLLEHVKAACDSLDERRRTSATAGGDRG